MESLQTPFVFLSYAHPDRERVLRVYDVLSAHGISAWLDVKRLRPGEPWDLYIERALGAATAIVLLISRASIDRTGYVQREMRMALEKAQYRPVGRIYAIPVLLDPGMPIPEQVSHLHCLTLSGPADHESLVEAIRASLGESDRAREAVKSEAEIDWEFHRRDEAWEGHPGYEAQIVWPAYTSARYPLIAHVSDAIRSEMQMMLAGERAVKLEQQPDIHSFGQEKVLRTNALSITLEDPLIKHRVLTQYASVYGYWAGAAHGYHGPRSWVFVLEPLVRIARLEAVFQEPVAAFTVLQAEARIRLFAELEAVDPSETEDQRASRTEWIATGTADWNAFSCFGFEPAGVGLRFPPYQVTAYSFGTVSVLIPYAVVKELLRRPYFDALGLNYTFDEADAAAPAEADAASWPPPSADGAGDWWK
jgi:hypothetical protein